MWALWKHTWLRGGLAILLVGSVSASGEQPREAVISGQIVFERNCAVCHGIGGTGGRGPSLNRARLSRAPDDAALRALIQAGIPPEMPEGVFLTDDDLGALTGYVRSLGEVAPQGNASGNPEAGARIFARAGCPACHIHSGKGIAYGPELTDVGERRSAAYLHDAILNPATKLPANFLMVKVTTLAGEVVEGIRVNEDDFSIQVKGASGEFHSFRKDKLKALKRLDGETPMPAFKGTLTERELQNLIAYLTTAKTDS